MKTILLSIEKPMERAPCNGCGVCCVAEQCRLSVEILGAKSGQCEALEIEDGRHVCGIVRRPAWYMFRQDISPAETGRLSVLFASALGLGAGCDASGLEGVTAAGYSA